MLKSVMGYGTTGKYHYEGIEVLSYSLPVLVEFVEEESKALSVLREISSKISLGLVTCEEVKLWSSL